VRIPSFYWLIRRRESIWTLPLTFIWLSSGVSAIR